MKPCTDCGTARHRLKRGLCPNCYRRHRLAGTIWDHPRSTWPGELLIEEWALLRAEGYTRVQAAERLGVTRAALEKAIERAARRTSEAAA